MWTMKIDQSMSSDALAEKINFRKREEHRTPEPSSDFIVSQGTGHHE